MPGEVGLGEVLLEGAYSAVLVVVENVLLCAGVGEGEDDAMVFEADVSVLLKVFANTYYGGYNFFFFVVE